ncbi:hypothetical protein [Halococcoides cellulosivorans]|uniref:hypothetical protein n=1 Tax=Halococcoides cellulosivorans TaxID=1679096 RepID=UPI00131F1436|nr:hypothetical protein [Halococcoides cellulosivorans]
MSPTIPVSEDTKATLADLKDDGETWDAFLARFARRDRDVESLGGFASAGIEESMQDTHERLNDSFAENIGDE